MGIKDLFSFRKNMLFFGNIVAMIVVTCAIIFGVFKWLERYTEHGIAVTVPDIKGMKLAEAKMLLGNHTLIGIVSDSTYNTDKPGGIILETKPESGAVVKEKRIIYLTVNTDRPPMKIIPNLADNSSLRETEAKLLAMGFKLGEAIKVNGEKDWVYGIKYRGSRVEYGDEVPTGATLVLEVGSGDYLMEGEDFLRDNQRDIRSEEATTIDDSWF